MAAGLINPPLGFHFLVRFDFNSPDSESQVNKLEGKILELAQGIQDSRWTEVSGIAATLEVEEVREGGRNNHTYSLPKGVKMDKLTLKRGFLLGSGIFEWVRRALEEFEFSTCQIQVFLLNELHIPIAGWEFDRAFPVSWNLSAFNAMDTSYVVETLELKYNTFRKIPVDSFFDTLTTF